LFLSAITGGTIDFSMLETVVRCSISADASSAQSMPALRTMANGSLTTNAGGSFSAPLLTSMDNINATIASVDSSVNMNGLESITNSNFTMTAGALTLPSLETVVDSTIAVPTGT